MRFSRSRSRAGTAALLAVPLLLSGVVLGGPAGAKSLPARVPLPSTLPGWAAPSADRGAVAPTAPVSARVYLAGRDPAGLDAFARAVSDPRSPSYGHYLSARQVSERFGATRKQTDAVRGWLTSAGFRIVGTTAHYVAVQGDARAVSRAFGTTLHSFRKGDRSFTAPAAPASVPASIASAVLSITGLDTAPHQARPDNVRSASASPASARPASARPDAARPDAARPAGGRAETSGRRDLLPGPALAYVNSGPFSDYFGSSPASAYPPAYGQVQPFALRGYTGTQLRRAYGAAGTGLTGAGVTVAVVDAYDSPTLGADTTAYASAHGDAPYRKGQLIRIDPAVWTNTAPRSERFPNGCGASGWYGEQTLDVEAVHGVAPQAGIVYVGAASCSDSDLMDALTTIVDKRLADIVSNSWGEPEGDSDPAADPVYDALFKRGAAEGVGFYVSSGDQGDDVAATGTRQSDMPASLPWVTAVGGTSLALDQNGDYRFETGWGTDSAKLSNDGTSWGMLPGTFLAGAGGGTSSRVLQPVYQHGVVPDALAATNGVQHRVVPDVAAVADSATGFLVGQTQAWPDGTVRYGEFRIGGTSLASPVFAGIQALAQQAGGKPLGFANPRLYQLYGTPAFHDVTDTPLGAATSLAQVRVDFHNGVDATGGLDVSLRTMGHDSSLRAVPGFDDVTGVGSPAPGYLRSYQSVSHGFASIPQR
ncbi:subtilase family serine protease [Streptacidiphilus sp. MAP12-16]|uniref:S53 family peptidase n=1 Tax=Streptacidiphilus sp. MAP12-16 TaxID=3156300 RepID=UPI003512486E